MIIDGNGLIANAFKKYSKVDPDVYVFARGVSDSSSENENSYLRELNCLNAAINDCKKFSRKIVYFSSGGAIYGNISGIRREDMSVEPITRYGKHKLECERTIVNSGVKYLILRLPNVVGEIEQGNKNLLYPFLVNSVYQGKVKIYINAVRDLIDVDDVACIVLEILQNSGNDLLLNLASGISLSVEEIIIEINKYYNRQLDIELIKGGDKQIFSIQKLKSIVHNTPFHNNYTSDLIGKYVCENENI